MDTTTFMRTSRRPVGHALADLRAAHLEAGVVVAGLDLADATLWRHTDAIVSELAADAYRVAAAVTGEPGPSVARDAPPVVRVRELAAAQRRLFRALDRHAEARGEVLEQAAGSVRMLGVMLSDVSRSGQA